MARIAGVNLPSQKRVVIALTYVMGIGNTTARLICEKAGIADHQRTKDLSDDEQAKIRDVIEEMNITLEGDLRRQVSINIKRLMDMACLRGLRHRRGLPVRGQRTKTNARTRKGPAVAIAGKKK